MKRNNIITKALFLLFAVMSVAVAKAGDNKLYIEDFTIIPGETKTIAVVLDNEDPISSLQFDVTMPKGLSFVGAPVKNTDRLTRSSHQLSRYNIGGMERFAILENASDPAKSAIKLNEGALFTITVEAETYFKSGTIQISNIEGSDNTTAQAISVTLDDQTTNVTTYVADYSLNVHEGTLRKGETMEVGFLLNSVVDINGLEAVVELPEGIELAADEDGEYFGYTDRLSDNTTIGYNPATGKLVVSSLTADYFEGNEGLLFTFKLKATADFGKETTVQVNVKDVKVSNESSTSYNLKDQEGISVTMLSSYFTYEGVAYIIDAETGKFVAAGHDWGTRGIVNEIGLDLTFAIVPDTKFVTIDSRVANNANNHFLGSNLYMDSPAANWGLLEQEFGFYITNGTQYLSIDADDNLVLSDDPHLWIIVTEEGVKAQRLEELAAATAENPIDATWLIQGANFNRNDARNSAWTISEDCTNKNMSGGNNVNNCAESWHSTFTISQTIEGVPNGVYQMTAQGFWRQDGENEALPVFFINDKQTVFPEKEGTENSMTDASNSFAEGKYTIEPIEVTVTDGTITLGVKNETNTTIWCIWDNFRLTYLGAATATPDDPELVAPEGWTNLIANGNLAGEGVENYFAKESPSSTIAGAAIVDGAGKNGSRGIVVKSADEASNADAWNTQFWIKLNEALTSGTKLHVEFDYAATKAAKASTQAHGAPGAYQHWAAIGDVNFTTEWQHFSTEIEVSGDMAGANGMQSIAFNLAEEKTATEYYFDNFGVWSLAPAPVSEWKNLIVNSDMEGESMECFYVTEQGAGGPFVAIATDGIGKDGSKAVKVQSADNPSQDWDTQFFVRLPYQLPAGTKYKVSFDYKADVAGGFDTQAHANPGQYIHYAFCGSGNFTTEWQTYEAEGTVPSQCDGSQGDGFVKTFQSIAFNLAKNKVATGFIFDNVKFEVASDVASTLTLNPDELGVAKGKLRAAYLNAKAIDTTGKNGADALATAISAAEDVLKNGTTVEAISAAKEALSQAISVFKKANLDEGLVEIAQSQGKDIQDGASRATLVEGEGYNTYTTDGGVCVIFKMYDVNVKDCDYVLVKFAEPVPAGIKIAFWSQSGTANVDVPAGATEYKYVFAEDAGCAIANDILPQITLLTLWNSQTVKVEGVYKHQIPVVDAINSIAADRQNGIIFNMNGQKVDKAQKGMYIINGKKVVIK